MHEGHTTMQSAINATGTTPIHVVTRLIAKPAQTGALQLHKICLLKHLETEKVYKAQSKEPKSSQSCIAYSSKKQLLLRLQVFQVFHFHVHVVFYAEKKHVKAQGKCWDAFSWSPDQSQGRGPKGSEGKCSILLVSKTGLEGDEKWWQRLTFIVF